MFNNIKCRYNKLPLPVKASFWFLICSFIQKGIQVITTPIFTRLMSTSEFGSYNVFNSWQSIFTILVTLNICGGVYSQGLIKYEDDQENYSFSMQILNFILCIIGGIIFLIVFFLFKCLSFNNIIYLVLMFIIIWSNSVFNFWASGERVNYQYKKLLIITAISSVVIPFLSIMFIKMNFNKTFSRIFSTAIFGFTVYGFIFLHQISFKKKIRLKKYWLHTLFMAIPLIPHYLSQTILNSSDRIMIEKMVNLSSAGIYSLAYSLSSIMTLFNVALVQTLSPYIFKKIKNKEIDKISNVVIPTIIFVAFVNLVLIAFAPEIVSIFAPTEYYEAIWIIPPVAMSVFFMFMYDIFVKFEFYYEKTKLISLATFLGAFANIFLNIIFINKYGYIAAGYTTLICFILYALFHYLFMNYICNKELDGIKPFDIKKIIIIIIVFLCIGFVLLFLYKYFIIRYIFILFLIIFVISKKEYFYNIIKQLLMIRK